MFSGVFTALVTPFKNGDVDYDKMRELVDWQIAQGVSGLVPCGTTGESATLTHEEHRKLILAVLEHVAGRVPVIAGAGSNSTAEAIALTRSAQDMGADAALVITPYYNKPSQEGMYRHFSAVAEAVEIPIILYNVPGRTSVNLLPETVARLTKFQNIVGVKEASGSVEQARAILASTKLCVLSGEDALTLKMLRLGAHGVISVTANLVPADLVALFKHHKKGNAKEADALDSKLQPLHAALFLESSPQPLKVAMKLLGRLNGEMRLPLYGVSAENEAKLQSVLVEYGLLKK